MLIRCDRHTSSDLILWAELEEADRAHGDRLMRSGKVKQSQESLLEFASGGPCYASTSWGKDSVVLCHLIASSGLPVPVWNLRIYPTRNPYCDVVRDVFLAKFPLEYHEMPVDYSIVDPKLPLSEWDRQTYRLWDTAWRSVCREVGTDRYVSGVRADESGVRKIRMRRWGLSSQKTCCPLGWWSAQDVMGYLAIHDLPVHPNYAMLGGGRWDRKHLRTAEIGDEKGSERGRRDHDREYYGDILRRLEASAS